MRTEPRASCSARSHEADPARDRRSGPCPARPRCCCGPCEATHHTPATAPRRPLRTSPRPRRLRETRRPITCGDRPKRGRGSCCRPSQTSFPRSSSDRRIGRPHHPRRRRRLRCPSHRHPEVTDTIPADRLLGTTAATIVNTSRRDVLVIHRHHARPGKHQQRTATVATCVILVATGLPRSALAQQIEIVELNDGSKYQGQLVEKVEGKQVVIQLATGEIQTFPWDQVASARAAPAAPPAPSSSSLPELPGPAATPPVVASTPADSGHIITGWPDPHASPGGGALRLPSPAGSSSSWASDQSSLPQFGSPRGIAGLLAGYKPLWVARTRGDGSL